MNDIAVNSFKAWMLASRPKTLTGAAVPVMIGLSMAYATLGADGFKVLPAVLCMLFAFVMQIDANFVNDYFDFLRGNDDESRLGPLRACAQGWITAPAMRMALLVTTVLACCIGLPLVLFGGFEMLLVGLACVLFCFLYTTSLSYHGLGDLLVLVFFGLVPVCVTYYIQTGDITPDVVLASLSCGLVIDTLLIVNNYRDIDNDIRAGKRTLIVRLGARKGLKAYWVAGVVPLLSGICFALHGHLMAALLPVVYMVFHIMTYNKMVRINKGRALNSVLADTARNILIYGLCVSAGMLF